MKDLLENLVKQIVDKPEDVSINVINGHGTIVFELRVNQCDTGKVIGRNGQTAKSLRILLAAIAAKHHQRSYLEILEPLAEEKTQPYEEPVRKNARKLIYKSLIKSESRWADDGGNNLQTFHLNNKYFVREDEI